MSNSHNHDEDKVKHGNNARVSPEKPDEIIGRFTTNIITDNETGSDGNVTNVLEDNAAFARRECRENQK